LAARALLAQKPREAELAQLSPNLLGRRPEPDDAKLRFGRRRHPDPRFASVQRRDQYRR
jgi:hypothetical protein